MRKQGFGIGGASLLLIFSVLCLTVFSLLTLSTVRREQALTEKRRAAVEDYYRADSAAAELAAALLEQEKEGGAPGELNGTPIQSEGAGVYAYLCPIDSRRAISVRLRLADGGLTVLSWKTTDIADWTPDESLDVWEGE